MITERDDCGPRLLNAVRETMAECGADDTNTIEPFEVDGVRVYLRAICAERWAALLRWRRENRGDSSGLLARLLVASVVDQDGHEQLTLDAVGSLDACIVHVIVQEVLKRNGITSAN